MSGITRDEWLKALAEVDVMPVNEHPDALTLQEFAALIGLGRLAAERRMQLLVKEGKAERVVKRIKRSSGAWYPATAYRLLRDST